MKAIKKREKQNLAIVGGVLCLILIVYGSWNSVGGPDKPAPPFAIMISRKSLKRQSSCWRWVERPVPHKGSRASKYLPMCSNARSTMKSFIPSNRFVSK